MSLSKEALAARKQEFNEFVWNHAQDAFQAKFDVCAALSKDEAKVLLRLLSGENLHDLEKLAAATRKLVSSSPDFLHKLLQLSGLTRNKIIQDIKAFARNKKLEVSLSSPEALFRDEKGKELGGHYLARQLDRVFASGAGHLSAQALEMLNQATWPGYIRQERAKRMGHEAEYRLACLLKDCRIPFAPQEKAENPLCRDVQIGEMSYDLVSPSVENALMRVVSTVHTANIGQYGESKDDLEIKKALKAIGKDKNRSKTVLLAFIDGVGFESNTAGLTGVLSNADEFCQFRTIWKAGVIAAKVSGMKCAVALPRKQHEGFKRFCKKYKAELKESDKFSDAPNGWVAAGDGFLKVSRR